MGEAAGYAVERDGGVVILTFNRPEHGNALPTTAIVPLTELFVAMKGDRGVRALLIRGEGRMFSAGGDVKGFLTTLEMSREARREQFRGRLERAQALIEAFIALDVPIVAACQGGVAGAGMTYALGADLVLADETVNFVFAHQRVGLPPDGGVSVLLPRAVGERRAAELVLTAAMVGAEEALRIGLVSRVVPAAELQAEALKAAKKFAAAPAGVVRRAKRLVLGAAQRAPSVQLALETEAIVASVGEYDFEEGVRAFLEKRKPVFATGEDAD